MSLHSWQAGAFDRYVWGIWRHNAFLFHIPTNSGKTMANYSYTIAQRLWNKLGRATGTLKFTTYSQLQEAVHEAINLRPQDPFTATEAHILGCNAAGIHPEDPLSWNRKAPGPKGVYKSTTHGPIPLSQKGRDLLQGLRFAIVKAIALGDYGCAGEHDTARARGQLALYMSEMEAAVEAHAKLKAELSTANALHVEKEMELRKTRAELKTAQQDRDRYQSHMDQARAWERVHDALYKFAGDTMANAVGENGSDRAIDAIRTLAIRAKLPPPPMPAPPPPPRAYTQETAAAAAVRFTVAWGREELTEALDVFSTRAVRNLFPEHLRAFEEYLEQKSNALQRKLEATKKETQEPVPAPQPQARLTDPQLTALADYIHAVALDVKVADYPANKCSASIKRSETYAKLYDSLVR
jgi:hypothetical protein